MRSLFGRLQRSRTHDWIVFPLAVFFIARIAIASAGYVGRIAFRDAVADAPWQTHPNKVMLDIWDRWDSAYFRGIAREGYVYSSPDDPGNIAFFPLYPLLIAVVRAATHDFTIAGILVSNLCFAGALLFLYRLALLEFNDPPTAQRAVVYISLFPTAFFFGAVYSESLYLLASVACLYFARRRQWAFAGVAGAFASATRVTGALLYGVLLIEWVAAVRARSDKDTLLFSGKRIAELAWIHVSLLGLVSYMLFLYREFGNPSVFFSAQSSWGRTSMSFPFSPLWRDLKGVLRQLGADGGVTLWREAIDVSASLLALGTLIPIWRRLGLSYAVYVLLSVLVPLATGTTQSLSRYVLVLFPIFLILCSWGKHPLVDGAIKCIGALLLAVLFVIFANWGFVA